MGKSHRKAMSLFELLMVVLLLGILFSIGIPVYTNNINKAKITKAIADIHAISQDLLAYMVDHEKLPESLADIGKQSAFDPWGSPYQYLKIEGEDDGPIENCRKDRFDVPLNSDFDLYSMGKNKRSQPSLSEKDSGDDIVRANNGGYIGLASRY